MNNPRCKYCIVNPAWSELRGKPICRTCAQRKAEDTRLSLSALQVLAEAKSLLVDSVTGEYQRAIVELAGNLLGYPASERTAVIMLLSHPGLKP